MHYLAEQALADAPGDASVHFMQGVACLERRDEDRAVSTLDEACRLEPDRPDYMAHYARALATVQRMSEACAVADRAMALAPHDASVLAMLGVTYLNAHAIDAAANALRQAVALSPDRAPLHFLLGRALTGLDDNTGAERELETCLQLEPRFWPAHLRLSMLRRQTPESQHLGRLRALLERHGDNPSARIFLNMALAKESEDLGDYATAFEHYTLGKAAARSTRPPSAQRDATMFEALMRCFPEAESGPTERSPDAPIFIVGMPRTGTTLLDRMLSSHPDVHSAGELRNFPAALQRASGSQAALLSLPDIEARTRHIDWRQLGSAYLESTLPSTAAKPRFTDKLPHNFLYAGFIARTLPGARILCLRRDALDTCLGNFRHLFELESGFYDYSLDLLDTGRYYIGFSRLLTHWHKVFPGRILEVGYEELVQAPEPTLRSVLAFCGLPWNDAVLRPQDNKTPLRTPNAWQVRTPVYTSAIGRWRQYAQQLQPLRAILAEGGIQLPD